MAAPKTPWENPQNAYFGIQGASEVLSMTWPGFKYFTVLNILNIILSFTWDRFKGASIERCKEGRGHVIVHPRSDKDPAGTAS